MENYKPLIDGPISSEFIVKQLDISREAYSIGALSFFIGQVRADHIDDKSVIGIEYSAYEQLIEKKIEEIINQLQEQYKDISSVSVFHSTGLVRTGEVSMLVIVSSSHRKQAFSALENCVEKVKSHLPVWKKELYDDSSSAWLEK